MFSHLDDPNPIAVGPQQRDAVERGVVRRRYIRATLLATLALAGTLVAVITLGGHSRTTSVRTVAPAGPLGTVPGHYSSDGLPFSYPSTWHAAAIKEEVSIGGGAELVASELAAPPRAMSDLHGERHEEALLRPSVGRPAGQRVSVASGVVGGLLAPDRTLNTVIDRRRATVTISILGSCVHGLANAESVAAVAPSATDNCISMQACLPAGHRHADAGTVVAMLSSLRISSN